jgi:REP element-mobilizing transposase RayT
MSRPPRVRGFSCVGRYRYFLTFCTFDRTTVFTDPNVVAMVLEHFRRTSRSRGFAILAYCFMPDRVHLLVEATACDASLKPLAKTLKQGTGQMWARRTGRRLWQEGYYDRVLRDGDDPRTIARYILANPVRAGLVSDPAEYPFAGSDLWTVDELIASL